MRLPKVFMAVAAVILITTCAIVTASSMDVVNWKKRVITVTGEGVAPLDAVSQTQARGLASRSAQAEAYRKLAEIVNGVKVEGETTVEKMLTTKDTIRLRVDATIKGAKIVNEEFLSDGGCRVTMQLPIFGASNSLAGAVFERNYTVEPFPEPDFGNSSSAPPVTYQPPGTYVPATPTTPYRSPLERMSVATLGVQNLQSDYPSLYQQPDPNPQSVYKPAKAPKDSKNSVEEQLDATAEGDYTGLVVDCRGLELQPVMSPIIKNDKGTKIYGHKNLDIDKVISMGMADYVDDSANVARAGENPLVIKAVSVENFNSNPVVAISDSNRILIENNATKFLKDLKVVFLFD